MGILRKKIKFGDRDYDQITSFEADILHTFIASQSHRIYGTEILRAVSSADGGKIRVGRLYEAIDRLYKDLNLIERAGDEEGLNGTTRRYWKITALGQQTLAANVAWWNARNPVGRSAAT